MGADDERGALNHLTDAHRAHAASLVRDGSAVSSRTTFRSVLPPRPHFRRTITCSPPATRVIRADAWLRGLRRLHRTQVHGLGITHIDALCHMFVRSECTTAAPPATSAATRPQQHDMSAAAGIIGRGVLLDVPAAAGVDSFRTTVGQRRRSRSRRRATEAARGVGDILIISTGRDHRVTRRGVC